MRDITGRLDSGIAELVIFLRQSGFDTFSSCEGGPNHWYTHPVVMVAPNDGESVFDLALRMMVTLENAGYSGFWVKQVHACRYCRSMNVADYMADYAEVVFWERYSHDLPIRPGERRLR